MVSNCARQGEFLLCSKHLLKGAVEAALNCAEQKRGRESFLDKIAAISVEDPPCHAVLASLLETSRIMS